MQLTELMAAVEAILFVTGDPVRIPELAHSLDLTANELREMLNEMAQGYIDENRGIRLNTSGEEVFLSIDPARASRVETFLQPVKKQPLTQAVMETLSVIAYKQPVTRAEIEAVRGVKCDYSLQMLIRRGLVEEAGQRETLGHPTEFRTTDEFLRHFGIPSLNELPDMNEMTLPEQETETTVQRGPFSEA